MPPNALQEGGKRGGGGGRGSRDTQVTLPAPTSFPNPPVKTSQDRNCACRLKKKKGRKKEKRRRKEWAARASLFRYSSANIKPSNIGLEAGKGKKEKKKEGGKKEEEERTQEGRLPRHVPFSFHGAPENNARNSVGEKEGGKKGGEVSLSDDFRFPLPSLAKGGKESALKLENAGTADVLEKKKKTKRDGPRLPILLELNCFEKKERKRRNQDLA